MSRAPAKKTAEKTAQPKVEKKTLERVARGKRVVLRRGKKDFAAVVSLKDLKALERLEEQRNIELARKPLARPYRISLEEFLRKYGR